MANYFNKKNFWISGIVLLSTSMIFNSCKNYGDADKKYDRLEYAKAIPLYKKALKKDTKNSAYWAKLGDCYRKNNQVKEAENCYANAVNGDSSKSVYKFEYALTLMSNEKYPEALEWMEKYLKEVPDDSWGKKLASGLSHVDDFFVGKDKFKVQNLTINSSESEFGSAFYKDGIIFTSCRSAKIPNKDSNDSEDGSDQWTGKGFYSIFYAKGAKENFEEPVVFLNGIQSQYHNTSACFNNEATELFMTRNLINNKKNDKRLTLQIYISTLDKGKWESVKPFPYNSDDYSCAHPALSPDGKKLYFASDMPGALGGMDLWVSNRTNNSWDVPVNLGPKINTKGNDVFPTMAEDGNLYFSSNGHEGIGGLDLYCSIDTLNNFSDPINLGAPFNSSDDDFSLILDKKNDFGYLSSNRTKKGNDDDIFYIEKIDEILISTIEKNSELMADNSTNKIIDETKTNTTSDSLTNGMNAENTTAANKDNSAKKSPEISAGQSPSVSMNSDIDENAVNPNKMNSGLANNNVSGNLNQNNSGIAASTPLNSQNNISSEQPTKSATNTKENNNSTFASVTKENADRDSYNNLPDPKNMEKTIWGKITHKVSSSPLENVAVKLINLSNLDTIITYTGKDGVYSFSGLDYNTRFKIASGAEYCNVKTIDTNITANNTNVNANMELFCSEENIALKNIYYDYDKSNIRPDAAKELDKLVKIMKQNPELELLVTAFTDCRGSASYNKVLSQKRAASVVAYLESSGIDRRRLIPDGEGEVNTENKCDCLNSKNTVCPEDEYQRNRRAEFKLRSKNLPA